MKYIHRRALARSTTVLIAIALAAMMLVGGSVALANGDKASKTTAALAEAGVEGERPASATGDKKPVFVSGNSTYSDCGVQGSDYALALTGDLKGCWSTFIEGYRCKQLKDYDLYFEKGREVFAGKFHGKQGRFRTTYTFKGAYARGFCQSFDPTLEVGGGCRHPLRGVSGVFGDAKGVINFIDVITDVTGDPTTGEFHAGTGGNNFLYYGRIDFDHRG